MGRCGLKLRTAVALHLLAVIVGIAGDKVSNGISSCCSEYYNKEVSRAYFCQFKSYFLTEKCFKKDGAVLFVTKFSKQLCADPRKNWVKQLQQFIDKKVKCKRKPKNPSVSRRVGPQTLENSRTTERNHGTSRTTITTTIHSPNPSSTDLPNMAAHTMALSTIDLPNMADQSMTQSSTDLPNMAAHTMSLSTIDLPNMASWPTTSTDHTNVAVLFTDPSITHLPNMVIQNTDPSTDLPNMAVQFMDLFTNELPKSAVHSAHPSTTDPPNIAIHSTHSCNTDTSNVAVYSAQPSTTYLPNMAIDSTYPSTADTPNMAIHSTHPSLTDLPNMTKQPIHLPTTDLPNMAIQSTDPFTTGPPNRNLHSRNGLAEEEKRRPAVLPETGRLDLATAPPHGTEGSGHGWNTSERGALFHSHLRLKGLGEQEPASTGTWGKVAMAMVLTVLVATVLLVYSLCRRKGHRKDVSVRPESIPLV